MHSQGKVPFCALMNTQVLINPLHAAGQPTCCHQPSPAHQVWDQDPVSASVGALRMSPFLSLHLCSVSTSPVRGRGNVCEKTLKYIRIQEGCDHLSKSFSTISAVEKIDTGASVHFCALLHPLSMGGEVLLCAECEFQKQWEHLCSASSMHSSSEHLTPLWAIF